ncbi:hypothetical protein [Thauera chlorobenzoica]|uniref:hypothetical protein n=1 Tax=Thauera chlorobenzoica TaxID=96773 RepID=UPI0008A046DB|nr:hypothetical protein [Thauera chlorobenzoica]SEF71562.1 hypothetical protein SAMN05216242_104121 [Thauera chlorobenzoica]
MTEQEKSAFPFESAPTSETTDSNYTADTSRETNRGLFHALTWRGTAEPQQKPADPLLGWHALAAPAKLRGKAKRNARRGAVNAKRHQGGIQADLLALLVLATVAGLLLVGKLR